MPVVVLGFLLDLLIGDPKFITHPVVLIGKTIEFLEKCLRKITAPVIGLRASGILLTLIVVGGTYTLMWSVQTGAERLNHWFGLAVSIWFMGSTLAVKGLAGAAEEIYRLLNTDNLLEARKKVGWIVGRDTAGLDESEITRATVETVAENIVDGIIAPLFYGFIGGAPLAMAYKAVNTLDSMVGYKNEKYRELGWASARFDDISNYIPARLTGIMLLLTFIILGKPAGEAYRTIRRDSGRHPSPNSGIPEAAVAGALGIRLGGINYYGGVKSFRAFMGEPKEPLSKEHIAETVKIMYISSFSAVLTGSLVTFLIISGLNCFK